MRKGRNDVKLLERNFAMSEIEENKMSDKVEEYNVTDSAEAESGFEEERIKSELPEEEYRFIRETVKKRPIDRQKVLAAIGKTAGLGILFGLTAGLAFRAVTPKIQNGPSNVTIVSAAEESDDSEQSEAEVSESAESAAESEAVIDAESVPEEEETPTAAPTLAELLETVAEEPGRSVVTVTYYDEDADWFSEESGMDSVSGLAIGDNGDALLVLARYQGAPDRIEVTMGDGALISASVLSVDPETEFAVLGIDHENLTEEQLEETPVCTLGESYTLKKGEQLIAIGSPMGYSDSVNYGEITSLSETFTITDGEYPLISTNMSGSSAGSGVLINLEGEIVGMIYRTEGEESLPVVTGIPISPLKSLIETLSNNKTIGYLGIRGLTVTEDISEASDIPVGVYVSGVDQNSPALSAGIQTADVITSMNDRPITSPDQIRSIMLRADPDSAMNVTVERQGSDGYVSFTFTVTLGELT